MPLLGAQCSTSREQAVDHQTPPQEKQVKATSRPLLLGRTLGLARRGWLFLGLVARHGGFDFLGTRRYSRQSVGVLAGRWRGSRLFWRRVARLAILLCPRYPPLSTRLDDAREEEEEEEAPHEGIAAHQPAIVCLRKVKIGGRVHLDQQRGVARCQHAKEDAAAQKEDAIVFLDAAVPEADALRRHDFERRQEAADAVAAGVLFAVSERRWRDVRQHDTGVQGRDEEQEEGDLEGHPDPKHVADHAAQEEADGLAQHDAALQLPKHGGALHGLDQLAGDGVDDEDVARRPAEDRDELGGLDDGDARGATGQDANDLRADADGGDKGLQDEGEPRAPFLDGPARQKEVEGPAKGGAHAQQGELGGGPGGDVVHGAAVAGAGVGRVGFVVDVALHQVEDVEDGDLGEGEAKGDEEAGEEDLDGVGGAKDAGQPRGLLGVGGLEVAAIGGRDSSILVLVLVLVLLAAGAVQERRPLVSVVCCHGMRVAVLVTLSITVGRTGQLEIKDQVAVREISYGEQIWRDKESGQSGVYA